MPQHPLRPLKLLSSEQIPSFWFREQSMAWHLLNQCEELPEQKNFVSFVGRDHLLSVAKHLTMFINDREKFKSYQAPPHVLSDSSLKQDDDARKEMMKTLALATTVFEEEVHAERDEIPFIHKPEDIQTLKDSEREIERITSLVSSFEDMEGLGLKINADEMVPEAQMLESLQNKDIKDVEALKEWI